MLNCRACLWRCIRAVEPTTSPSQLYRPDAVSALVTQQRFLRTGRAPIRKTEARPSHLSNVERAERSRKEPWKHSAKAKDQKRQARATIKRRPDGADGKEVAVGDMWLGKRDPRIPSTEWNARKKELQWLKDPLEVASFVQKELRKGKDKEMMQLVRMASHSMQCTVSWNNIIDYYLAKERVNDGLKVYNEMKKRAQFPDSYTYTILLRGLSINAHRPGALSKAIAIYHSMSAPNSRVQPSIIHTNAVLRVCARALDMDSMWGIIAKIPESGPGAANAITYTTILNAIRQSLLVDVPMDENSIEVAARRERGVVDGRRIWEDVVKKWRNADLVIEEELVCSMGRLLLTGARPRDWDDVLSLVEQTMDIPRLVPRLGTSARQDAGLKRIRAPYTPEEYKTDDDPEQGHRHGDEFLALTTQGKGRSTPLTYATPGNNTLSILQEACQKIVANKAAEEYWQIITDPTTYGVVPDVNNLHMRLRVMRQNRASGAAARCLQEDFVEKGNAPKPGTFRIAMSTCVRDKNNHNSLKHASKILDIMTSSLPDADPKAVIMYAELALSFPLAKGDDLVDALTRLQPIINNIRMQLGIGAEDKRNVRGAVYLKGTERQDGIAALGKIYAVYDRLLFSNLIAEELRGPFKAERARLSAFIGRVKFKDETAGRKWEMAKEALNEGAESQESRARNGSNNGGRKEREEKSGWGSGGNGGWRARKALPEEKRRPWFPKLQGEE